MSKKQILISIIVASIILVCALIYYFKVVQPSNQPPPPSQNQNGVEGTGDFNVGVEPISPAIEIAKPDLDRAIVVSDKTLPAEVTSGAVEKLKTVIAVAKKNPADYQAWTSIGLYRKMIGDYQGAAEVWLYVLNFQKQNHLVMSNLGNLYAQNLKDYPRAEKYYLMNLSLQPNNFEGYINLYQLYKNQYKEKIAQAPVILKQGIEKNPDSIILMIELARHYKVAGDIKSAQVYYEQAIGVAVKIKDTSIEKSLREELAGISQ